MDLDEDGIGGGGGDEDNFILPECEVCGEKDFLLEAGFYYCKTCNTQSQASRQFISEELPPDRTTNIRQVGTLRKERVRKVPYNLNGNRVWLSSWDVYNMLIQSMSLELVKIGFPEIFRRKVFQLWSAYLLKRGVVFLKPKYQGAPDPYRSRITTNEPNSNLYALYGVLPPKRVMKKKKVEKKPAEDNDNDATMGLSQAKKKKTMNRRKAFEKEYLTHASQMSETNLAYENVTGSTQKKSETDVTEKPKMPHLYYSDNTNVLRANLIATKRRLVNKYDHYTTAHQHFNRASDINTVEKFSMGYILALLFIAARQIGCHVLLSDFFRLFNDGTLYVETMRNILEDDVDEDDPFKVYRGGNQFLGISRGLSIRPINGEEIESLLNYIGIKNFNSPTFEEFLPKFIDDFTLPREFECLLRELESMFTIDETLPDLIMGREKEKYLMELWTLVLIVFALKMLFGLDDVTEKYQSRFAQVVNTILNNRFNRPDVTYQEKFLLEQNPGNYFQLFDIEDWCRFLRTRENLIGHELFSKECYKPHKNVNISRVHDVMQMYCQYRPCWRDEDLQIVESVNNTFQGLIDRSGTKVPDLPMYHSIPFPRQSIVDEFKKNYPAVGNSELDSNILEWNFGNRRIDFIWNPEKYIPLLNKAGYEVKVVRGDAINYRKRFKLREKKLILFQPYKKFDDFVPLNYSDSMEFIIRTCNNIYMARDSFGDDHQTYFHKMLNTLMRIYTLKGVSGKVPLKEPNMFSSSVEPPVE